MRYNPRVHRLWLITLNAGVACFLALGYLLAAAGPPLLGGLRDLTGGWSWPVAVLLAALVPMTWAGWGAARNAVLTEDSPEGARTLAASAGPGGREHH